MENKESEHEKDCLARFANELPPYMLVGLIDRQQMKEACNAAGISSMAEMLGIDARELVLVALSNVDGVGPKKMESWRRRLLRTEELPFEKWVELSVINALRNYRKSLQ